MGNVAALLIQARGMLGLDRGGFKDTHSDAFCRDDISGIAKYT